MLNKAVTLILFFFEIIIGMGIMVIMYSWNEIGAISSFFSLIVLCFAALLSLSTYNGKNR